MRVLQRRTSVINKNSTKTIRRFAAATLLVGSVMLCAGSAIASPNNWRKRESGIVTESFKETQDRKWAQKYVKEKTESLKRILATLGVIVLVISPIFILDLKGDKRKTREE